MQYTKKQVEALLKLLTSNDQAYLGTGLPKRHMGFCRTEYCMRSGTDFF